MLIVTRTADFQWLVVKGHFSASMPGRFASTIFLARSRHTRAVTTVFASNFATPNLLASGPSSILVAILVPGALWGFVRIARHLGFQQISYDSRFLALVLVTTVEESFASGWAQLDLASGILWFVYRVLTVVPGLVND